MLLTDAEHTRCVANHDVTPTSEFISDRSKRFEGELLAARVRKQSASLDAVNAEALANEFLADAIYTNMIMLGFAWQKGLVPISLDALRKAIDLNGVAVQRNLKAFDIGRISADDPSRVETAERPRQEPKARTIEDLTDHRAGLLTDYQNAAYAQTYRSLVETVRKAETDLGLGEDLTRAVATFGYKLMAYKDEYEVARLYTDGDFKQRLKETFQGDYKFYFHLAPPLIAKKDMNGHLVKKSFGQWMYPAFKVLAKLKGLRGTAFDFVGWTAERKMERRLRDEYLANMARLASELTPENHSLAIRIASVPDDIRGFGHVKEASVVAAEAYSETLWSKWPAGDAAPHTPEKTTLIAAE